MQSGTYSNDLERVSSFSTSLNHFKNHSVLTLARDGFYNTSRKSQIKCYSCGFSYDFNTSIGDPIANHKRESPFCRHITLQSAHSGATSFGQTNTASRPSNSNSRAYSLKNASSSLVNRDQPDVPVHRNRSNAIGNAEQNGTHDIQDTGRREFPNRHDSENIATRSNTTRNGLAENVNGASRGSGQSTNSSQLLADFRLEYCRKESFRGWPSNAAVSPDDLANAGFRYLGVDDKVQCAFCKGILRCWEPGDRPLAEHLRHFPTCEFLLDPQAAGNVPLGEEDRSMLATVQMRTSDSNPGQLSGILMDRPVNPRYANVAERLSSFSNFPSNSFQEKDALVNAGFFYTGQVDAVKCFFCNVTISDWQPNSDPWVQHAKASNRCGYVLMNKGESFVTKVQQNKMASQKINRTKAKSHKGMKYTVDQQKLDQLMTSQMVISVMDMGNHSPNLVRKVIQNRLEDLGNQFPNAEALTDGIADYLECKETADEIYQDDKIDTAQEQHKSEHQLSRDSPIQDPEGIFESSKDSFICKVCLDNTASIVFLKCGHLVCCNSCAPELTKCPICREKILGTICVDL